MNRIERLIGYLSPKWAMERAALRDFQSSLNGGLPSRLDTPWSYNGNKTTVQTLGERMRLGSMRDRGRNADQNNPIAHGILNRLVDNVVGKGFTLRMLTESKEFNKEVEERFYWESDTFDIRGMLSWPDLQRDTYRGFERDGDIGTILADVGGLAKLQTIDGSRVETPHGRDFQRGKTAQSMFDGVETNAVGTPTRFWVRTQDEIGKLNFEPVSARDFVWLARTKRSNQYRGETCLAQVFGYLDQVDGYVDAVVIAARMAAIFGLVFREQSNAAMSGLRTTLNSKGEARKIITLENGQVKYVGDGSDVSQVDAKQPMTQTPDFIRIMLRLIGVAVDMPLELTLMDFSQTNYSSARSALLQFYRAMAARQEAFKRMFLSRVYRWWVSRAIARGLISTPAPEDYLKHDWIPHGWQWVDPVKELQAALLEADMGINSLTDIAASQGRDFEEVLEQRAVEEAMKRAATLPPAYSTMTRSDASAPQQTATPGAGMDNPDDNQDGSNNQ